MSEIPFLVKRKQGILLPCLLYRQFSASDCLEYLNAIELPVRLFPGSDSRQLLAFGVAIDDGLDKCLLITPFIARIPLFKLCYGAGGYLDALLLRKPPYVVHEPLNVL